MGKTRLKILRLWIEKWKLIMLVIAILGCNHFPKAFVFIELIVRSCFQVPKYFDNKKCFASMQ